MSAEVEQFYASLGESVLEHLKRLHSSYDSTGATKAAMAGVFGLPKRCLVCAKPLAWRDMDDVPNDVDPWFCGGCCPICYDITDEEIA